MATFFHKTDTLLGRVVVGDGPAIYTVFIDGAFWGWVSGEKGSFMAIREGDINWGPSKRTRAQAVDARDARAEAERTAKEWRSKQVPTDVKVVRLTAENIDVEGPQLAGWLLADAEDLGEIVNARLSRDGYRNAMIIGTKSRDMLGLPSTVTAYKL